MTSANKLPFNVPEPVQDRRLVRRYLMQSIARMATWQCAGVILLVGILYLLTGQPRGLLDPQEWGWKTLLQVGLNVGLVPVMLAIGLSHANLRILRESGQTLTAETMSSRPRRTLTSVLDPLTTFDLCAETLSGLAMGEALGYRGPAAFWHSAFQGRILLGSWRPLWLGRSIEVNIGGQPGEPVQIHIRRRPGIDRLLVQSGRALRAVETVAEHLERRIRLHHNALQAVRRAQELESAALHAKLSALQAQVEPHFLFNTLANLKYLIRTDADAAQQMLDHLVGYLQNALPDMRSASSTVERELALARSYLSIMQIRMGQRLRFHIGADDAALGHALPPAMLISLVENAVKHGLERASRPGEIAIIATLDGGTLRLRVRDDGVGLTEQMGQGFGLANLHERLQLLYGERASLSVASNESGGVTATLTIKE